MCDDIHVARLDYHMTKFTGWRVSSKLEHDSFACYKLPGRITNGIFFRGGYDQHRE